jgi:hypothetical protein
MEGLVAKQRELVIRLETAGQPTALALETLDAMERTLELAPYARSELGMRCLSLQRRK